jgi:hypothetical protein
MSPSAEKMNAARYLAQFGACLLKTKCVERSNSVRIRLFRILCNVVACHREDIPSVRHVFDLIRETGGFDRDEGRFRHCVAMTLAEIGRSPAIVQIAKTLETFNQAERDLRVIELAVEALERQNKEQKLLALAGDVLWECDQFDELRRDIQRI